MTKTTQVLLAIAILVIGLVAGMFMGSHMSSVSLGAAGFAGGPQFASDIAVLGNIFTGASATQLTSNGTVVAAVSSTVSTNSLTVGGGTAVTKRSCATATWNPGSVASSGAASGLYVTSTDIALPGTVAGDLCVASLSSATSSGLSTDCTITGTATATIALYNISGSAIDPATGTAKVCYTH